MKALTEPQKAQIKEEFKSRRRRQIILALFFALFLFSFVLLKDKIKSGTIGAISPDVAGPVLFGFVMGALIFSLKNWRCPACNKYLGKTMNPKFCPSCGVELR